MLKHEETRKFKIQGDYKVKKIRIIDCNVKKPLNWYENRLGEEFEVKQESDNVYFVYEPKRSGLAIILKEDAEEI